MTPNEHDGTSAARPGSVAPPLVGRPFIRQDWNDVVFLHWKVRSSLVAPLLPRGTRPDELPDAPGESWVGLIGFVLADTTFPPGPTLHRLGTFVEINVRLYSVDESGRRGVVFLTLDAGALLPVLAANAGLGLPYRWASAHTSTDEEGVVSYASRRAGSPRASTEFSVRPAERLAEPTALDDFLTARWGMHVRRFDGGGRNPLARTRYWPNEHESWPLQRAELVSLDDGLVAASGLPGVADSPPDSVLFAAHVRTRFAFPARGAPNRAGSSHG